MKFKLRDYIVAQYLWHSDLEFKSEKPSQCPHRSHGDLCRVSLNHYRHRKVSGGQRFAVYSCSTHRRSFTVYPPGYRPYQRRQIIPVDHRGRMIGPLFNRREGICIFSNTTFDDVIETLYRERKNQCPKRISDLAKLLGISPEMTLRQRERHAAVLNVELTGLALCAKNLAANPSLKNQIEAIRDAIALIPTRFGSIYRGLLEAVHIAGLSGKPIFSINPA
jgi:hypothetical protein